MGDKLFSELFDQYTWLHFAVGYMFENYDKTLIYTIILHTIFEIFKNSDIGLQFINEFYIKISGHYWSIQTKNSFINSVGGTIATILGWITARVIKKQLHVKFDLNNLNYRKWLYHDS